jgi:DNA repair protein RadC
VFKAALLANAAAIILAHNHPSGDATPSVDDCALTQRLQAAGDLLGIDVLDHVVIGDGQYISFKETGRL